MMPRIAAARQEQEQPRTNEAAGRCATADADTGHRPFPPFLSMAGSSEEMGTAARGRPCRREARRVRPRLQLLLQGQFIRRVPDGGLEPASAFSVKGEDAD